MDSGVRESAENGGVVKRVCEGYRDSEDQKGEIDSPRLWTFSLLVSMLVFRSFNDMVTRICTWIVWRVVRPEGWVVVFREVCRRSALELELKLEFQQQMRLNRRLAGCILLQVWSVLVGCGENALMRAALALAAPATPFVWILAQLNHMLAAELYDLTT